MAKTALEDVRSDLIGAWRLLDWREVRADGSVDYPLGPEPIGQIMYDSSGRMSAQLVRSGQNRFASEDWRQASIDEMNRAWPGYFGYFGTFTLDVDRQIVVHHIEGSWFPNLCGSEQVRHYRLEANQLQLVADTPWGHVEIVWEKIS